LSQSPVAPRSIDQITLEVTRSVIAIKRLGEEAVQFVSAGAAPPGHIRQEMLRVESKIDSLLLEFQEAGGE